MGGCTSFRRKSSMLYDGRAEIAPTIRHPRPTIPQQDHYPPSSIFYGPKSRFATYIRPTPPIYPKISQYGHALNRSNASQARPSKGRGARIERRLNRNNTQLVHPIEECSPARRYTQYARQELKVAGEHTHAVSQQTKVFNSQSANKSVPIDYPQGFTCFIENICKATMAQEGEVSPPDTTTMDATMLALGGNSGTKMGNDSSFASSESEKIIKSVTFNDETEVFWLEISHSDGSEVSNWASFDKVFELNSWKVFSDDSDHSWDEGENESKPCWLEKNHNFCSTATLASSFDYEDFRSIASSFETDPGQRSSGTEFQASTPNCYGISRATAAQDSPEGHLSKDQSIATVLDDFWDPIVRHPENLDITDLPTSHISNQVCDPRLLGKIPTIGSSLYPNLRTPSQCPNYEPSPFFAEYHQTFAPFLPAHERTVTPVI